MTNNQKNPNIIPPGSVPWEFGFHQKIQAKRIKTSAVNINNFIALSASSLGLGTVGTGAANGAFISTTLTPQSPHAQTPNFAIPLVGVFVGTSPSSYNTNYQIYPTVGGSVTPGQWDIRGDNDYNGDGGTLNGTISAWNGVIINNSGTTGTLQFVTRWKYLNFNSGTVM